MSKFNEKILNKIRELYDIEEDWQAVTELTPRDIVVVASTTIKQLDNFEAKTKITIIGTIIEEWKARPTRSKKVVVLESKFMDINGDIIDIERKTHPSKVSNTKWWLNTIVGVGKKIQILATLQKIENGMLGFINYLDFVKKQGDVEKHQNSKQSDNLIYPKATFKLKKDVKEFEVEEYVKYISEQLRNGHFDKYLMPKEVEDALKQEGLIKFKKATLADFYDYVVGLKPFERDKISVFLEYYYKYFLRRIVLEKIWRIIQLQENNNIVKRKEELFSEDDFKSLKDEIKQRVPFKLTSDQEKTINTILNTIKNTLNRKFLIFGDVGSGKTMVAFLISLMLLKKGKQIALITPTSVLSKQHYKEAEELFKEFNIFYVDSNTKKREINKINKALKNGEPALVIGSTTINSLQFSHLELIVIDEEQKMGISEKERLHKRFPNSSVMYMTATPIPRTLASALFSQFEILEIKEKPKTQKPRITKVSYYLQDFKDEINKRIGNKEQVLVVVPAIDSDDMMNAKKAVDELKKLFKDATIATINGKQTDEENEEVINNFMSGKIDILVSTTMVDSGFSNKNITSVIIMGAERFGISQLHQIRGRCGRGEKQGYCYLIPKSKIIDATKERLDAIRKSEDGFELAKKDLDIRGSGDLVGKGEQKGKEINFLDYDKEIKIMRKFIK
jgi:RecG-like helicase